MAPATEQNTPDVVWATESRKTITDRNLGKGLFLMQAMNVTF